MRPRVFPAEDFTHIVSNELGAEASMRPRVFPAEDVVGAAPPMSSSDMLQ